METNTDMKDFFRDEGLLIEHNKDRLYNAIIYFSKNTINCDESKLGNLLYLFDAIHIKETGVSATGLEYAHNNIVIDILSIPIPVSLRIDIQNIIDKKDISTELEKYITIQRHNKDIIIVPKKEFNNTHFTKRQLKILKQISDAFKYTTSLDINKTFRSRDKCWEE